MYLVFADIVVALHFLFIVFAVSGGILCMHWHKLAFVHIPCFAWAVLISFFGWICPLTHLEVFFLQKAGASVYTGGFVNRMLSPVIYPSGLTRMHQVWLGAFVLVLNLAVYIFIGKKLWKNNSA